MNTVTLSDVDAKVERAADKLQQLAERAQAEGGLAAKLAQPLADDAQFLRKLKPSLIRARIRGEAPTNQKPAPAVVVPSEPRVRPRPASRKPRGQPPNPWLVIGAAFVAGIVVAKVIDWRGHAHPRY
jgi:hypothetical protein